MSGTTGIGSEIYGLACELFPICRSLTGEGVRETLAILKRELPLLSLHEVPSGTICFDWTVPDEWNIRDAFVIDPDGRKIIDFKDSNLHVVGYSEPVNKLVNLDELQKHLYSLPEIPEAIPYVTSYYARRWGFCLADSQRRSLRPGDYHVVIDSTLAPGSLTYGELIIPGESKSEILLSTYICHPSMANNELSGPVVTCFLAKWLLSLKRRRHTFRVIFIPETIGSILYISRHLDELKRNVVGGFNITTAGDERCYSYLPSRKGNTLSDRIALHVLKHEAGEFVRYSFLQRGSDERQYCSPGVDLPICSIMRSKYGTYPEYHSSLDNLQFISAEGLEGSYRCLRHSISCFENNEVLRTCITCEPQMGRRGLYPTLGTRENHGKVSRMMNLLAYADGTRDLLDVCEIIGCPMWEMFDTVETLKQNGLLRPATEGAYDF